MVRLALKQISNPNIYQLRIPCRNRQSHDLLLGLKLNNNTICKNISFLIVSFNGEGFRDVLSPGKSMSRSALTAHCTMHTVQLHSLHFCAMLRKNKMIISRTRAKSSRGLYIKHSCADLPTELTHEISLRARIERRFFLRG